MQISVTSEAVGVAVAAAGLFSAAGAWFVRSSVEASLDRFQVTFLEKLNGTYIRRGECALIREAEEERVARVEARLNEIS